MTTRSTRPTDPRSTLRSGLPDRYLTSDDIAEMFEVSKETVYTWRKKRIGPPAIRIGKYLRYDPAAVHAWAQEQTEHDAAA
ncbi:helix-turn-helix domain-containing protein [Streptomyces javensis]|uniref:helix-turn-helix domain-containing protein n=1 Tax=Streptomyces javensis TaxID=114698 RepID=UPI0033F0A368